MYKFFLSFLLLAFISFYTSNTFAQQAQVGCMDKAMRVQSETIKRGFKAQGMTVYRDAMLNMQTGEPTAIGVELVKGKLYQFIYICNKSSSKAQFELYNGNHKKLMSQTIKTPSNKNFVIYSFIPTESDVYLVVLNQSMKKKSFLSSGGNVKTCGSFAIMQKAN